MVLALLGLVLTACGEAVEEPATTTTAPVADTTTTAPAPEPEPEPVGELLVWTDHLRAPVVEAVAPTFTEATGVAVSVEIVDFGEIKDQVALAGPAGEGPDLFIGPHDWTGELAASGVIDPIDVGAKAADFFEVALGAFSFDGELYGVPYATEAIAMYYNTELVAEAPATFEEIGETCAALEGIGNCIGLPGGGDGPDAYHHYPFVSALGGYIFAYDPEAGFDPSDVGLDNEGALAGIDFLQSLVEEGLVAPTNYDDARSLFLDGQQPFWITGPWERGTLEDQDTMSWSVAKLPTIDGQVPGPFVGAQGFFLSAFSENKVVAQSFLLDFIATAETMRALYDADPRNPAFTPVFEQLADDPVAQVFALSAADGVPMPNIPQMGAVWGPLGDNLLLVRNGDVDAETAMSTAAEAVRAAVQ